MGAMFYFEKSIAPDNNGQQIVNFKFDADLIRTNGVYTLYDTSKASFGIEGYKAYTYISPILFQKNGFFLQSPYCAWPDATLEIEIKNKNQRFDFGKYYLEGNKISLEGTFTFFARGMDWRQLKARYEGYINATGDTLFLKLAEPYPKINLKFNKGLAKRLKDDTYQIYFFKSFENNIILDKAFFDSLSNSKGY
jgi:hypothetical protein